MNKKLIKVALEEHIGDLRQTLRKELKETPILSAFVQQQGSTSTAFNVWLNGANLTADTKIETQVVYYIRYLQAQVDKINEYTAELKELNDPTK